MIQKSGLSPRQFTVTSALGLFGLATHRVKAGAISLISEERGVHHMDKSWEYNHSGVFTKDFKGTTQYYKNLGIAAEFSPTGSNLDPTDSGEIIEFDVVPVFNIPEGEPFLQLLCIGDFEMEVLHAETSIPHGEMLAYREGCNHICISVQDIDAETEKLLKKGMRIIQDFHLKGKRLEDYLDTREFGHILLSFRTPMTDEMKKRKATAGIVPWKFIGHTAIVKDLDKTVRFYEYLEIADFLPEKQFDTRNMSNVQIYSKPPKAEVQARTRKCKVGDRLFLELVEPGKADFIYRETLYRRGEGIMDVMFSVKDLKQETARLTEKGVPKIFCGQPQDSGAFAVFDTRAKGGDVLIKLIEE
jgi:catechol 2,3-dioxygenase-like lactoylglutathione lyase family enzyme